ncbi:leucine-rich repeat receptor protein kinase HPCA1-like [Arachis stenosperma]|uniref:leucine-rich repeat receptor protein kinase HPCA1-like n=1 Tax=Arachis stenosperma TaxID=217475 RepID=UPI0025AC6CDC|nr:leucine-rich repeat receptor protein kinase HPCA1-like [Arachis stenosperma]
MAEPGQSEKAVIPCEEDLRERPLAIKEDLSFNKGLKGPLSPEIGDLSNLNILILAGCSFNGSIPDALANLSQLSFFHFNKNQLSGTILPNFSALTWFSYMYYLMEMIYLILYQKH